MLESKQLRVAVRFIRHPLTKRAQHDNGMQQGFILRCLFEFTCWLVRYYVEVEGKTPMQRLGEVGVYPP